MAVNPRYPECALGLLLGLSCNWSVIAIAGPDVALSAIALADSGGASRDRLIDSVQRRFNAKVVRITETTVNGRPALELRLLSDQRVWNVVVDAESGQVLSGG